MSQTTPQTIGIHFSLSYKTAREIARVRATESDDNESDEVTEPMRLLVVVTSSLWSTMVYTEEEDFFGDKGWGRLSSRYIRYAGVDLDSEAIVGLALLRLASIARDRVKVEASSCRDAIKYILGEV